MPLTDDLAQASLNANAARRVGDESLSQFWTETANNIGAQLDRLENPWDCLKGSPDTSRLGHG